MTTSETHSASDLPRGTTLTDGRGDTLEITERHDGEITWNVNNDDETETFSVEEVQAALDYGEIEIENVPDASERGRVPEAGGTAADYDASALYIRFGNIPEGERSYDHRNDRQEDGVSVYACDVTDEDDRTVYKPRGQMLQTILGLMGRGAYLVTGERVGTGADGEPLLRDVEGVVELSSPEGVAGFVVAE